MKSKIEWEEWQQLQEELASIEEQAQQNAQRLNALQEELAQWEELENQEKAVQDGDK